MQLGIHANREQRNQEAKQHYFQAIKHFQKVCHYRAISQCYKSLSLIARATLDKEQTQSYWAEHLDYLHQWRCSQPRIIDCLRPQGEEFALQCEIVVY